MNNTLDAARPNRWWACPFDFETRFSHHRDFPRRGRVVEKDVRVKRRHAGDYQHHKKIKRQQEISAPSEESRLQRFAWFRRKQELLFVHHRHANSNFAVIHFFWDRILGTYRRPEAGA
jgi:hypothetical protein